jgi:hypothetical protein
MNGRNEIPAYCKKQRPVYFFYSKIFVNDILKAETAESIMGKPIVQLRIIHNIRIGRLSKGQFVFFSDGMEKRSRITSYTYQIRRLPRLYNRCTVKIKSAGFDKPVNAGFYFM